MQVMHQLEIKNWFDAFSQFCCGRQLARCQCQCNVMYILVQTRHRAINPAISNTTNGQVSANMDLTYILTFLSPLHDNEI